jgi:hypothetical protein
MYRELFPLRQALSAELKANLSPAVPGIDSEHLLQSYLDRLTMYVGCDVADQILTFFAVDTAGDELGHLSTTSGCLLMKALMVVMMPSLYLGFGRGISIS